MWLCGLYMWRQYHNVAMFAARYTGIYQRKGEKRYTAYIHTQGKKKHHLGQYAMPGEAACVYDEACIYLVSLQNQKISTAVYVTLHCNTHSALVAGISYLICSCCYHSICKVLTTVCDCRRGTLSISLGPGMTRLPYVSFLNLRPSLEQSSLQHSD